MGPDAIKQRDDQGGKPEREQMKTDSCDRPILGRRRTQTGLLVFREILESEFQLQTFSHDGVIVCC
jgi:hypothetical protein